MFTILQIQYRVHRRTYRMCIDHPERVIIDETDVRVFVPDVEILLNYLSSHNEGTTNLVSSERRYN